MSTKQETELLNGLTPADRQIVRTMLSKGADRRAVIRWMLAAGATAATSGGVLLGAEKARAETPKRGGHYRVGIHEGNISDSLDPATTNGVCMIQVNHTNRNFLTEITPTNEVAPEICESWEASADAKSWVFKLRQGVEFHNGKTFTADDAVASLNYHRKDGTKSAAKTLLEDVVDIRADGKDRLVIELEAGNADLPFIVSDYHFVMMPSDGEGEVDISGVGTGAYVIEKFEPGVECVLSRNPNYFKEDRAHFDEVTFLVLNDSTAANNALMTSEVDAVSEIDIKTVALIGRSSEVAVEDVPSGAHCTIPMQVDVAPFDNLDLRLALKYAIDREKLLTDSLQGHGVIGNDHPIGPNLPYYSELPQRAYDPDKARFHLKKAGYDSIDLDLSASDAAFPGALDTALLFQASAAKAGININVVREPNDGFWSNVWLIKPFIVASWGARPTPDVMFSLAYKQGAEWNESHWANERFNALLIEAKAELDAARRTELYHEMMMLCRDDGGTIVPFFRNRVYARRANVRHGPELAGNWPLDGARSAERWWFA